MTNLNQRQPPDIVPVLRQLKDFQQHTVEYIFQRMYLDDDRTRRFLLADEVGLGKTLVARGVIAKTIQHLWNHTERIDIVYVCSNSDIARQNINRLNVTGHDDFSLASRITLLPINVGEMQCRRVNFVSFTPGTSFELKDSAGQSLERELLYWLLKEPWNLSFAKSTTVLSAYAGVEGFRYRVKRFDENSINRDIKQVFVEQLEVRPDLKQEFDEVCDAMPRAGSTVPPGVSRRRNQFIGEMRRLLAETCLRWLQPDLIILDEFQRFKYLLAGDHEDASDAAQLADHLFRFQERQDNPDSAARVLLLSATPYKMYTLNQESEEDDHYEDFLLTLKFLMDDEQQLNRFKQGLREYRDELLSLSEHGCDMLLRAKRKLEDDLRRIMVRTERLALSSDRNGMLQEIPANGMQLTASDVTSYLGVQRVARMLGQGDVLEYWKSSPYLLNFMEEYELKRKLKRAIEDPLLDRETVRAVQNACQNSLNRDQIERYRELDPANVRLRQLSDDLIQRKVWELLWVPPSLPYYQGDGPYADPNLQGFTKRLVFSSWQVVPKAIAAILSYQAEREMVRTFRRKARNTAEARKKRRALLRFTVARGRPAGMPALAMLYPCQVFAELCDPLRWRGDAEELSTSRETIARAASKIEELLPPIVAQHSTDMEGADERWYWAAPLLIDAAHHPEAVKAWFDQPSLGSIWCGVSGRMDREAALGFTEHLQMVRDLLAGDIDLGKPPEDLAELLSEMAVAGLGICSFRALKRVCPTLPAKGKHDVRSYAAPLAYAFLHLFNLPEVMYLLRDRNADQPYWRSVLRYCVNGNLQAVLDEYAHILMESLGLIDMPTHVTAEKLSQAIESAVSIRTSTAKVDMLSTSNRRVWREELRLRTRFAMRFGDQDTEDSSEPTRADAVRSAFNSPFWPFVLATTSIGQEGLDFHPYCHAVVHWNLPSNPVDLEQREGRVHRYKGHALRKNIATAHGNVAADDGHDPWEAMFRAARDSRPVGDTDLFPFWITPDGRAKIERHLPTLPHSREVLQQENLKRSLVLYRMVFGQNRQEDLVRYLLSRFSPEEAQNIAEMCRIDLSPRPETIPEQGASARE